MDIADSARKWGVLDEDIQHAVRHAFATVTTQHRDDWTMYVGPDRTGSQLLEIGVISDDDGSRAIHAMEARDSYKQHVRWLEP